MYIKNNIPNFGEQFNKKPEETEEVENVENKQEELQETFSEQYDEQDVYETQGLKQPVFKQMQNVNTQYQTEMFSNINSIGIKKAKPKKSKKFWKGFFITIFVLVVVAFATIVSIKDTLNVYGMKYGLYKDCINLLNKPVNEEQLLTNKITEENFNSFKLKAQASDLNIFNTSGNVTINFPTISIKNNLNLTASEMGAMINSTLKDDEDYNVVSLLQLQLSTTEDVGVFEMQSILKLNLSKIKNELGGHFNSFPSVIYLTNNVDCYVSGVNLIFGTNNVKINQLSDSQNAQIIKLFNEIQKESIKESKDKVSLTELNSIVVRDIINSFSFKTNTQLKINENAFDFEI